MKRVASVVRLSLLLAAMAGMSGCAHLAFWKRPPTAPPLQTGRGSIDQEQEKINRPAPPSTLPQPEAASEATPPELPSTARPKVKRAPRRHTEAPAKIDTEQAESTPSSQPPDSSSPIGKLTAGESSVRRQTRQDTLALIRQSEDGLAKVRDRSSAQNRTTISQAEAFLGQARTALKNGDADGAHTLATKAKLLVDELAGH